MKISNQELLDRYLLGLANDDEIAEIEKRLLADTELRQRYLQEVMTETDLRSFSLQEEEAVQAPPPPSYTRSIIYSLAATAAVVIILITTIGREPKVEAAGKIKSSERAGWQSMHATIDGATLDPGIYVLQTGEATLFFSSGAETVLHAPAKLEIVSAMKLVMYYGQASFSVPESAVGFQVSTRFGEIVDHGTRFSLRLDPDGETAKLTVDEGEISIEHRSGTVKRFVTDEMALLNDEKVQPAEEAAIEGPPKPRKSVVVFNTEGQETSIIDNNRRDRLHPDFLLVKKKRWKKQIDRRALFTIKVPGHVRDQTTSAKVILNAVPTGMGLATNMPLRSKFVLYGIPDDEREDWPVEGLLWENAPKIKEATPLATFFLQRAEQRDTFELDTPELLDFVKSDRTGKVSFIIACKTGGRTLVHGFASSRHGEAAGPRLVLGIEE